ncbi:electron transport complex protein RnfD [Mobilisporobacter senegalensis]|uniref:Ion-translocating oxidoreductase complex subunit D n=1 Tax=Mobilisporobacter senegalensis TaxID=1329262 RepID=A0A3N1XZV5_9FIRM|nr:RnfABCDGE type electron transport complex subunit D [Mobilisporobacter senegalensis]ROR31808.1 electron transport complex protein RnfD [Mobilisporobacter senegalensis]
MSNLLNVSASPHIRRKTTSSDLMFDVILALMPASLYGVYQFGLNAFLIIITSIATCVLSEYTYEKLMKKPVTTGDYSAFLTGLLLALNLPSTVPLWIPVIGSVFAIIVVKQLYGGLGQNFMNPALAARCFLLISFAGRMTTFTLDGVSGATPLAMLKETGETVSLTSLFAGNIMGTIGETSAIALLIGAIYLIVKKVISIRIPLTYLGTFLIFLIIFGGQGFNITFLLSHLLGGGLILGAFFMATDYVTSPITLTGQIVYGIVLGIFTGIFRIFGGSSEGVSYAIIFCNLLVPLIEKVTIPVPYGRGRKTA